MWKLSRNLLAICTIQLALIHGAQAQLGLRDKDVEFSQNWLEQVRVGVPDDRLLAAALVARLHDAELADKLLSRALESLQPEAVLLSTVILTCFSATPASACQDDRWFEQLLRIDALNLEPRLYMSLRMMDEGNSEGALGMLNEGLTAPRHSIYFYDKADFLEEQLVSVGYPEEEASYPAEVYANSSANYSMFLKLLATCTAQSVVDERWKLACLFLGAKMQNTSEDLMAKVFGGAIQRDVLKASGADEDVIQLVIEHNEWINKVRDMANDKVDWMSPSATTLDQPDTFIEDTRGVTEFEAILRALYRTQ